MSDEWSVAIAFARPTAVSSPKAIVSSPRDWGWRGR